jgi:hypothetical protein
MIVGARHERLAQEDDVIVRGDNKKEQQSWTGETIPERGLEP